MDKKIYEKNMESLRNRFPQLAAAIEERDYQEKNHALAEVMESGVMPVLRITRENRKLYINGPRRPSETAKRKIEQWGKLRRNTPVCIVGMGDMAFIQEILIQTDDSVHIMVYEPSVSVFLYMLKNVDIRFCFDKRALGFMIEGLNSEETEGIIASFVTAGNYSALKQWVNISYKKLFPEAVLTFLKKLDRYTTELFAGRNTAARYASIWAENIFRNIRYLCDGSVTRQLCDVIPRDIPAILVSAGPSLNKNIKELKRAKNRAFIVAVDTAVKPLVKEGILPDLYVIVDGRKPIELLDFEEARQIPLMPSLTSTSAVLAQHTGKKIFYSEGITLANNLMAMNCIPFSSVDCGGSVACSGFSLLYKMGFERIILVGQDLALTGNKSHADGTFQEKMETVDTTYSQRVEGNYEKEVPTRTDFKLYLDWFNYYIEHCEETHVINATEGGAKIKNTEIMTLKDAIDRECGKKVDISSCMEKLEPVFDETCRKKAIEYLNTIPRMFRGLKKRVHKGRNYYETLQRICKSNKFTSDNYLTLLEKIKKITKQIESHELYPIITETISVANILIVEQQFYEEEDFQSEVMEIAKQGITFMKQAEQCIDLLLPLAEETVGSLR